MRIRHPVSRIFPLGGGGLVGGGLALLLLASCAPPPQALPPAPASRPAPPVRPATLPAGPKVDWRDARLTPGTWRWSREGARSVARFADGLLVFSCDPGKRIVTLARRGAAEAALPMTIITSSETRPVTGVPASGGDPALAVQLAAGDPLLDALAFSRGRFAVEAMGLDTLYVPSWAEVTRVVEDCR